MKFSNLYIKLFIVCLCISSCSEDFLDRQPLDQVVSTNFYQSEEDAKKALVSIYDALGYQSAPGVSWAPIVTMSDMLSDDAFAGGGDANDGKEENEFNTFNIPTSSILAHAMWINNYVGIYRANLYLEVIGDIEASPEFKTRTIAEAKFLRAYFYFELVRFFENVPLLTETIKSPSDYNQPQAAPQAVYNQIAKDLVESINDLPTSLPTAQLGRITKWAAEGLLARVFLFHDGVYGQPLDAGSEIVDRTKALSYLEDMISNSGHALLENYNDLFRLYSEFSAESVFEISYADSPVWWDWNYARGGEGNLAAQMQGPRVTESDNWDRGWSFAPVSHKLYLDMENDPRIEATILVETELDGALVKGYQHTGYFSKKYSSDVEHWGAGGQFELNRTCNYRVIRFADVLLMAAELGSPNAQNYLDQVRARVGLPSIPATDENIFDERRLELSLEGIRYFDVLRKGVSYASETLSDTDTRGPFYVGDQQLFNTQFNAGTKGFLPIPQAQIDLSAGTLIQNQGY